MEHLEGRTFEHLTQEQVDSFMNHGFLRIKNCFSKEAAEDWSKLVWARLGFDRNEPSTWTTERTNMPQAYSVVEIKDFAPKAWDAMCELVGGEERVTKQSRTWGDAFIVNLGTPEAAGSDVAPRDLKGWHVDGDFFVHFLDSPEQGLLTIPCWTDVKANGGATWVCDQGPRLIGQWLHDHPEGVLPTMTSVDNKAPPPPESDRLGFYNTLVQNTDIPDSSFHEMTGSVGDVILLHPHTLHTASKNGLRLARIITNPPLSLTAPFNFSRPNSAGYSLVELKTLSSLSHLNLQEWKRTSPRAAIIPERIHRQAEMWEASNKRLKALGLPESGKWDPMESLAGHRVGAVGDDAAGSEGSEASGGSGEGESDASTGSRVEV